MLQLQRYSPPPQALKANSSQRVGVDMKKAESLIDEALKLAEQVKRATLSNICYDEVNRTDTVGLGAASADFTRALSELEAVLEGHKEKDFILEQLRNASKPSFL